MVAESEDIMLYLEYEGCKVKYNEAQRVLDGILNEKEILFQRTQPQSTLKNQDRVSGGKKVNQVEEYTVEVEKRQINERLEEAKSILDDRMVLLEQKRQELEKIDGKENVMPTGMILTNALSSSTILSNAFSAPRHLWSGYQIIKIHHNQYKGATAVTFADGEVIVVRRSEDEPENLYNAVASAIAKRCMGVTQVSKRLSRKRPSM